MHKKPSGLLDIVNQINNLKKCLCNEGIDCKPNTTSILPKLNTLAPNPPIRQVIASTGTGGVSWQDIKYVRVFGSGEWVGTALTVLQSAHGKGPHPMIQVYEGDVTSGFSEVNDTNLLIKVDAGGSGNITLTRLGGYAAFNGKIIII